MKKKKEKINKNNKPKREPVVLTLKGTIELTKSGMGFVKVEGMERDVKIFPENLNTALNGDTVKIQIVIKKSKQARRTEGIVKEVVQRKQSEFTGILEVKQHFAFLIPDSEQMPVDIFVPLNQLHEAKDGDRVMVKITEWNSNSKKPVGEVIRILTNESANEIAMQSILSENGFPLTFPDDVLEEAARIPDIMDRNEIGKRRDMRDTLTFTIDPVDAKDFDDAISIKPLKNGWYEVGVHIADVSHYVKAGSELDKEAYQRATSVYLPDRVLPMLPEHLSNVLCSLRPNEDKFTFSAIFTMNKSGNVKDYWLGKTVIRSIRRYTYEEVQEIIEGATGDYDKELLLLDKMAKSLRAERFRKGAINFSSTEIRFKLDDQAKPIGIVIKESKDAHQLIEELMLLANRTVATYVSEIKVKEKPLPFPYRVHSDPDEEKLATFAVFAAKFGYRLNLNSPSAIATSFNEMLTAAHGRPEQHVIESLGIRTMAKAVYTTENEGHYGLGFENYCHFTSPIRRYPDVLVHRILEECLEGAPKPIKQLEVMCKHCSDQERNAMEAERSANKYKQVEFMQQYEGEEFDAVVSGVSSFGFWAETVEHKCEGFVHVNDLLDVDTFDFIEEDYTLVGRRTQMRLTIGNKIRVRVVRTDLARRRIDFALEELPKQTLKKAPPLKEKKKRKGGK